jgi:hypothetical protein
VLHEAHCRSICEEITIFRGTRRITTACIRTFLHSVQIDCGAHPAYRRRFPGGGMELTTRLSSLRCRTVGSLPPRLQNDFMWKYSVTEQRYNADFFFLRWESSLSISLGYGLGYLGIRLRFLANVSFQTGSGSHPVPHPTDTGLSFHGG